MDNPSKTVVLFVAGLVALHLAAFLLPPGLTWGFHFLVFLGPPSVVLYLVLIAALLLFGRGDMLDTSFTRASSFMARRGALFIGTALAVFAGAGFLFRLGVPLLGDSWFLVKNFSQVLSGTEPLYPRNEPLATYYYSGISGLMGIRTYGDFLDSFFVADMLMGAGFLVVLFFIVRELAQEEGDRFPAFLLAASLPSSYLFFGYVETYAPVCFAVSLYILAGMLYLRRRVPFTLVVAVFLLQTFTHYLTLLLTPSLAWLAWTGIRRRTTADVLTGVSVGLAALFGGLLVTGAEIRDLYSQVPHTHYLPLTVPAGGLEEYSFPYTLFSAYHLVDFANLVVLLGPAAVFLCAAGFLAGRRRRPEGDLPAIPPGARFLCWGPVPVILFAFVAKFDLGIARDWDVTAPFAFLFALAAAALYLRAAPGRPGRRVVGLLAAVTLSHSLLWFSMNASGGPALDRFHTLLDPRIVSQSGIYSGHLSLALFHHQTGLGKESPAELWQGYVSEYPRDGRGYVNVLRNMKDASDAELTALTEKWRQSAGSSDTILKSLFGGLFEEGNLSMEEGRTTRAITLFGAALRIDPSAAAVYNNIGIVRARAGDMAGAAEMFEETVRLDSSYSEAYINLGRAYAGIGKREGARRAFGEAARRGNPEARIYLDRLLGDRPR